MELMRCGNVFIHEKEANSIFTKSGLKHLVAVTPSICLNTFLLKRRNNRITFL